MIIGWFWDYWISVLDGLFGRVIGWDYWIGLLDGFFFFPTLMGPAARRGIPRRDVFFCVFYVIFLKMVKMVKQSHFWTRFFEK